LHTRYDALAPSNLERLQDGIFAFTQQFFLSKLGTSTSWSEPTDLTTLLVEGTLQITAWTFCGSRMAESHGEELAKLFHILEHDLSLLGIILKFPTPAIRRREMAKNRSFEIFREEFRQRVHDMRDGKVVDDDYSSIILSGVVDDDLLLSGDESTLSARIDEAMYTVYGLIWAVRVVAQCRSAFMTDRNYLSRLIPTPRPLLWQHSVIYWQTPPASTPFFLKLVLTHNPLLRGPFTNKLTSSAASQRHSDVTQLAP
jgi:hypothetical protein